MAAHGTSYPPRPALLCPPFTHSQGSEHLQGWRVLGASRRLPCQAPAQPCPPTSTRWWYSGAAAATDPTAGSAAASISF